MNLQFFIEKLENSPEFENFKKENPDAFLSSGFFVLDFESNENKSNLDFYNSKTNKMFGFQLDDKVKMLNLEMMQNSQVPTKLNADFELDFKEIEAKISNEMEKQKITNKLQKIIMIFQNYEDKDFVFCTVFLSGFGILKVHFDNKGNITLFEKKTLFDFIKKT